MDIVRLYEIDHAVEEAIEKLNDAFGMLARAACYLDEAADDIRSLPESFRIDDLASASDDLAMNVDKIRKDLGVL